MQARKALLAQITLLASGNLPEPADLSAWWATVETALELLDNSFDGGVLHDPSQFSTAHVKMFAPLVLGARGW